MRGCILRGPEIFRKMTEGVTEAAIRVGRQIRSVMWSSLMLVTSTIRIINIRWSI